MAHKSETTHGLRLRKVRASCSAEVAAVKAGKPAIWLFILPYDPSRPVLADSDKWSNAFKTFCQNSHGESVICILTTPPTAATIWPKIQDCVQFQLWVTVKLEHAFQVKEAVSNHHAALLVLTKYRGSLRHTKTRIAYTYCPYCDRTTKDYGGKKHTYHEYGTLMSDVWRDISCKPTAYPNEIVRRLRDLFGLKPYTTLHALDLRLAATSTCISHTCTTHGGKLSRTPQQFTQRQALLNGDCLQVLKQIPTGTIDFCFADPPYNLKKKYDCWDDTLEIREYFDWCDAWLGELARVLKTGRTLAVLNIPQWAIRHFSHLRSILDFQNWIVWEGLSLPVRMVMPANYAILCFSKGKPRPLPGASSRSVGDFDKQELSSFKEFYCIRERCIHERKMLGVEDRAPITDLWWDIHRLKHNSRRADHPCQLPSALMRRLIALFTSPDEIVLDPFNGVGTTTLAAEQLNRSFLGIEISNTYHQEAKRRHEELRQGLDPFRKRRCTPQAKNSRVPRLKKQKYLVSKKQLQLDVKRIAQDIGRIPSREEVCELSKYPISYYDEYFISWGEVCAAARTTGMSEVRAPQPAKRVERQMTFF